MGSGPVFWKWHHAAASTGEGVVSCLRSTPPAVHATLQGHTGRQSSTVVDGHVAAGWALPAAHGDARAGTRAPHGAG